MDKSQEKGEQHPLLEVIPLGQASKVTQGSSILYPWYEAAPPPFDRYCQTCSVE